MVSGLGTRLVINMRLLVKVDGVDAMIVGYVSVEGRVNAVLVMNGALSAIDLELIQLPSVPKQLRKKTKHKARAAARVSNGLATRARVVMGDKLQCPIPSPEAYLTKNGKNAPDSLRRHRRVESELTSPPTFPRPSPPTLCQV